MQRRRVHKLRAREIEEKRKEAEQDLWFNQDSPMTCSGKTWKEKRIDREENGEASEEESELVSEGGLKTWISTWYLRCPRSSFYQS
jgi:hypothetical protein